jgi:hypothetical protein
MPQPFKMTSKSAVSAALFLMIGLVLNAHALPVTPGLWAKNEATDLFGRQRVVGHSLRGIVLDENGEPIQGARLMIEGVVGAATSEDGTFTLSGLAEGASYLVLLQRAGYSFASTTVMAKANDYLTLRGTSLGDMPQGCSELDNSTLLVSGANAAAKLYTETLALSRKLPPNQPLRLLSGEVIRGKDLPLRLQEQYATFQFYNRFVPEVDIQCEEEVRCPIIDVREAKLYMLIELDNLSHERLLTNRVLRTRGRIRVGKSISLKRLIVSLRNEAKARIEKIRRSVGSCY